MAFLKLENVSVGYHKNEFVVKDLTLDVERGEFVSLLGPSGCGKTTTLRVIAGFLRVQRGRIVINGKVYNNIPPNKRNIGFVFQNYALFPHLNVFENVAFGLKIRRFPKDVIKKKVSEVLEFVGLKGFEERLPSQLSGGQQQRVAIARAIVVKPDLLLMDEPLSNLDAKLRIEMRAELRRMQKELGITTVYVTHDQAEALSLSDRVAVMNRGGIEQFDTPENLFLNPKTLFVARFVGFQDFVEGEVVDAEIDLITVRVGNTTLKARSMDRSSLGMKVTLVARPKNFEILESRSTNSLKGEIVSKIFQGDNILYVIKVPNVGYLKVEIPVENAKWREKEVVFLRVDPENCLAFSKEE